LSSVANISIVLNVKKNYFLDYYRIITDFITKKLPRETLATTILYIYIYIYIIYSNKEIRKTPTFLILRKNTVVMFTFCEFITLLIII